MDGRLMHPGKSNYNVPSTSQIMNFSSCWKKYITGYFMSAFGGKADIVSMGL
jgi:hypothetical protein